MTPGREERDPIMADHNFLKTDVCSHIENLQVPLSSTNSSVVCSQQQFACERRELYSVTRTKSFGNQSDVTSQVPADRGAAAVVAAFPLSRRRD